MQRKEVVRYSEAFKIQVIRELESGLHRNYACAREAYGIGSSSTIINWHRHYGSKYKKRRFIRVESETNRDELERLKKRVRELEGALSDTTMDLLLERQYVQMACEEAGIEDVSKFKKKGAGSASPGSLGKKKKGVK